MSDKKIPEDVRKDLEHKHGEIFPFETPLGEVAFRQPRRSEYQRFQAKLHNEKQRHLAGEELIRTCVVYPELKALDDMLDARPFLIAKLANALIDWCSGGDGEAEGKD